MSVFASFADLVGHLAHLLQPVFHTSATAAAIVLFTIAVRLLVHPLSRAAARGQRAQARLSPRIAELRHKHHKNPDRLHRAMLELYQEEKVSPTAGCLPSLLQLPAFFLLYRTFSAGHMGGHANALLGHTLLGAPLSGRFTDALAHGGLFGARGLVYLGLFAVVAVVATFNYRKSKKTAATSAAHAAAQTGGGRTRNGRSGASEGTSAMAALTKAMPLMSFLTLITVAVVPLAAALYVVTSTTWSVVERHVLHRDAPEAANETAPAAKTPAGGKTPARSKAPTGLKAATRSKVATRGKATATTVSAAPGKPAQAAKPARARKPVLDGKPASAGRLGRANRQSGFPRQAGAGRPAALPGLARAAKAAEASETTTA